jgi:hypothetical protein
VPNPEPLDDKTRRRRRRGVTVGEIVEFLEYLAPPSLSVPSEPSGLQVGSAQSVVKSVVVSPLATYRAISTAVDRKAALLITAAPLPVASLSALRWDDPIGAKIAHLAQRQISLYALSNSCAAAPGGFDDSLAERLGLAANGSLLATHAENQLKFAVFVPREAWERVRDAAADAGAGQIGRYSHCSFRTAGTGTFLPLDGANPTLGGIGILEEADEFRLEMVVPERELRGVIAAVLAVHPYEEVAYDVYPLRNPGMSFGRGRIGDLPLAVALETVLAQVNDALELPADTPARCLHRTVLPIQSLAVASGMSSGESLLWEAHRQNADAVIVGSASLDDLMIADSLSTALIEVGFAPSVTPGLQKFAQQLRDTFAADGLEVIFSG